MTVKTRLVVSTALVLAVALAGLVAVVTALTSSQARDDGLQYARSLATSQAQSVGATLQREMATAEDLAGTLAVMASGRAGDRHLADGVERQIVVDQPALIGAWSIWEPGAFDRADAAHVTDPESDASGRYLSYWFRDGQQVSVT